MRLRRRSAGDSSLKLCDNGSMVRWPLPGAGLNVDPGISAAGDQRFGYPHVIDPQTPIAAKGSGPIIPPGKLSTLFVVKPERIGKSPALYFVEGCTLRLAAHDSLLPELRIVDVASLRRHIEVAAKDERRANLVVIIEKAPQPFHPVK